VSDTKPYDFECKRAAEQIIVEVKGTTSTGEQIILTKNEVAAHQAHYPNNALIVVRSITLTRSPESPSADGGELLMLSPWEIIGSQLTPLAFQYTIEQSEPSG
jgi:hypothetical protein